MENKEGISTVSGEFQPGVYQGYRIAPIPTAPTTSSDPPPPYEPILEPVVNQQRHENFDTTEPVVLQPTAQQTTPGENWMTPPQRPIPDCPPGLEYLTMIDQLLVHQKIELLEAFTGYETKNKFHVRNSVGQNVYYALEDSNCCTRNCCGPVRPFGMKIFDNYRREVMHLYRPLGCQSCCFPCCLQKVEVSAPPGTVIGSIRQEWSIFYPTFAVKNANMETVLRIEGPFFTCSCGNDVNFKITSGDGTQEVGRISKQWSGLAREAFTDADNFGISFPLDLDVKMKAVLLGGLFLIDAMFYERTTKRRHHHHHG